jgi:preprotein translocase subunit YajC
MSFIPLLQAAGGAATTSTTGGFIQMIVMLVLIFAVFYFLIFRPQNKKQKETEHMIAALKKGDKIVTIGGVHGVVSSLKEKTVIVKVDDNTKVELNRSAVASVENEKPVGTKEEKGKKESKKDAEPAPAETEQAPASK